MSQETKIVKKRPRRRVMSPTGPLSCKPMKGYHLRWANINDPQDPNNIAVLLERGYTKVTPEEQGLSQESLGDYLSVINQKSSDSIQRTGRDGITAMLMKLPDEFYQEDLKEIKEYNDAQIAAMLTPKQKNEVGLTEFGESRIDGKPIGGK